MAKYWWLLNWIALVVMLQDVNTTIKALAKRKIEVIILQLGKLDVASPSGKLMLQMLAAVAEMERDLLVGSTPSRLAKSKEGKVLGHPVKTAPSQQTEIVNLQKNRYVLMVNCLVRMAYLERQLCRSRANYRYQNNASPVLVPTLTQSGCPGLKRRKQFNLRQLV